MNAVNLNQCVVSPDSLRVGTVVQWPALGFCGSSTDRYQGTIQHLYSAADSDDMIACSDVINLRTGELCEADIENDPVGSKLLSLSAVDKVVSVPVDAPLLTSVV